jgi:hypothetical protein
MKEYFSSDKSLTSSPTSPTPSLAPQRRQRPLSLPSAAAVLFLVCAAAAFSPAHLAVASASEL